MILNSFKWRTSNIDDAVNSRSCQLNRISTVIMRHVPISIIADISGVNRENVGLGEQAVSYLRGVNVLKWMTSPISLHDRFDNATCRLHRAVGLSPCDNVVKRRGIVGLLGAKNTSMDQCKISAARDTGICSPGGCACYKNMLYA